MCGDGSRENATPSEQDTQVGARTDRWAPGQTGGHQEGSWNPVLVLNTAAQTQVRARRHAARMLGRSTLFSQPRCFPGHWLQGDQGLVTSTHPWLPIAL